MLSSRDVQLLLAFRCDEQPVLSLYLDLRAPHGAAAELKSLLKDASARLPGFTDEDRQRLESLLGGARFKGAPALAAFSCGPRLWLSCPLPQPARSHVRLSPTPALAPLLNALDQSRRFGVLLLSEKKLRVVEVFFGEAAELSVTPPKGGPDETLKAAADQLLRLVRERGLERIIVSAPAAWESPLLGHMHGHIQDNLILDTRLNPEMTLEQARDAVLLGESQSRAVRESVLVYRLLDAANARGKGGASGVVGLNETVDALNKGRVRMLLVREGLARMGRRCGHCGALSLSGKKCLSCWLDTEPVLNLVAEMAHAALEQNCEVYYLSHDARLDTHGGVGAELRPRLADAPKSA